ncbi:hypothetical protein [Actinomadura oligospora]|uniref:hypothetical protein n=1 Tax=Actinomadura oligospora TaxID=111804 RepID=UPI00047AC4C4|nr:hypothetical protein [Actinomadura oligospora]
MSSSSEQPSRPSPNPADPGPDTADGSVRPDGPTVILPSGIAQPDVPRDQVPHPDGSVPPTPPRAEHVEADTPVRPDGPTVILTPNLLRPTEHPESDIPAPVPADGPPSDLPSGHPPTRTAPPHGDAPIPTAPPPADPRHADAPEPAASSWDGHRHAHVPEAAASPWDGHRHADVPDSAAPPWDDHRRSAVPDPAASPWADHRRTDVPDSAASAWGEHRHADVPESAAPPWAENRQADVPTPGAPPQPEARRPSPSAPSQGEPQPPFNPDPAPLPDEFPQVSALDRDVWPLSAPEPAAPSQAGRSAADAPPGREPWHADVPGPATPPQGEFFHQNPHTRPADELPPPFNPNPAPPLDELPQFSGPSGVLPPLGESRYTGAPQPTPLPQADHAPADAPRSRDPWQADAPEPVHPPRDAAVESNAANPATSPREFPHVHGPEAEKLPGREVRQVDGPEPGAVPGGAVPEDDSDAAAMLRGERVWVKVPEPAAPSLAESLLGQAALAAKPPSEELGRLVASARTSKTRTAGAREAAATLAVLAVIVVAVPAAVLVLPDTSANVIEQAGRSLGLGPGGYAAFLRATGMSVPVLLGAVPVGAVAARRFGARPVLLAGVALLLAGLLGVGRADSVPLVGAVRAAQGMGAGLMLPGTLVLAWERGGRLASALWSGVLVASLVGAMPLALARVPLPDGVPAPGHVTDWRDALAPFPWCAAAVACVLPFCLLVRGRRGRLPASRHTERGQLVLPLAPAAGFAFIAVVTTYGWSPGGRLALAGLALLGLAGLALVGSRDATAGSPLGAAVVMVTTGLLAYPVAAPLAGITAVAARNGDGTSPTTYLPFAMGAASALAGALLAAWLPRHTARVAVLAAHALLVLATLPSLFVAAAHLPDAAHIPAVATASMIALGAGAGLALAMSLREAGVAGALFGLSLCFPAILVGQLVVLSLQAGWLQPAPTSAAAQLVALTGGYRAWLAAAAVLTVLLAAAGRAATRGRARPGANRSRAGASVQ